MYRNVSTSDDVSIEGAEGAEADPKQKSKDKDKDKKVATTVSDWVWPIKCQSIVGGPHFYIIEYIAKFFHFNATFLMYAW